MKKIKHSNKLVESEIVFVFEYYSCVTMVKNYKKEGILITIIKKLLVVTILVFFIFQTQVVIAKNRMTERTLKLHKNLISERFNLLSNTIWFGYSKHNIKKITKDTAPSMLLVFMEDVKTAKLIFLGDDKNSTLFDVTRRKDKSILLTSELKSIGLKMLTSNCMVSDEGKAKMIFLCKEILILNN